jgi:hypothetical protein
MQRFVALSDAALLQRIDGLDRAEHELHQGAMKQVLQAEARGRMVSADPHHQLLAAAIKESGEDMRAIEEELLRRAANFMEEAA